MDIASLNKRFSFGSELLLKQLNSRMIIVEIDTPKVTTTTAVHGHGLDGVEYVDLTGNNERYLQSGSLSFDGGLGRVIAIEKQGSLNATVWNPWASIASTIVDLGEVEWRNMLCVEDANTYESVATILPGETHTHCIRLFAELII